MLKEIICDKFNDTTIKFDKGLNVVLGDNLATNSIGKTLTLMIIDFVLGGNTYVNLNTDTVDNLGHHSFKFALEFNNEKYYFIRSTDNHLFISICEENYTIKSEISLDDYKHFLTEKYDMQYLGNLFRSIVGGFSRIWGKNNYFIDKPLKQSDSKIHDSIVNLIKLFNRYNTIDSFEKQLKKVSDVNTAITKATNADLIPSINKTQYNDNCVQIEELNKKISKFMKRMNDYTLDIDAISSEDVMELRNQKNSMVIRRNTLSNRLKRIKNNLNSEDLKVTSKLDKLTEFFPSIDREKLVSINEFHKKISKTLKNELKTEEEQLLVQIELLDKDIDAITKEIESKLNIKSKPDYNVEKLADMINKKKTLEERNLVYNKKEVAKSDLDQIKKELNTMKQKVLAEIGSQIDIKMYELFKIIYKDDRKSPTFNLTIDSYDLGRSNDTGTGSSYINLIAFDISILELTGLPFLIHDSILFKNIQVEAFNNLLGIYSSFDKQVFIAIDDITRFSKEAQSTLVSKAVVKLDAKKTLFIKDWKLNN